MNLKGLLGIDAGLCSSECYSSFLIRNQIRPITFPLSIIDDGGGLQVIGRGKLYFSTITFSYYAREQAAAVVDEDAHYTDLPERETPKQVDEKRLSNIWLDREGSWDVFNILFYFVQRSLKIILFVRFHITPDL